MEVPPPGSAAAAPTSPLLPLVGAGVAGLLWAASIPMIHPAEIGQWGLLSALPVTIYLALALLTVSFVVALHRGGDLRVVAVHVVVLVAILHATPILVYGTLRYSWAWKHVGLVVFFHRTHRVRPNTPYLDVYHNWPGFFAAATALLEAAGWRSALSFAAWAPPVFELFFAVTVGALASTLSPDRRVVGLTVWFFVITNWVGQDYFAPQAFAFALYVAALALVLRWLVQTRRPPRLFVRVLPSLGMAAGNAAPASGTSDTRRAVLAVLVLAAAIVTSHPLTPIALSAGLFVLAIANLLRPRWLAPSVLAMTVLWMVTGARRYVSSNVTSIFSDAGKLSSNVGSGLVDVHRIAVTQRAVSLFGRAEVVLVLLLAVVGIFRRLRRGHWEPAAILLTGVPMGLLAAGSYGGELVFRSYLFALPFAAYFGARACFPEDGRSSSLRVAAGVLCIAAILLAGFLAPYFGKEAWAYFSTREVHAAEVVYTSAPPGSLLVSATTSYPTQFEHYERFTYVAIANEPAAGRARLLTDPAGVLAGWLSDRRFRAGYVIITRSQKAEAANLGVLPPHAVEHIEASLFQSPRFRVLYHDRDASVFVLAGDPSPKA
jgi:hypothetical protein